MTLGQERQLRPSLKVEERLAVGAVVAASIVGAVAVGAHPSGNEVSDAVLVAAFAAALPLAASVARPWSWVVATTAAAACSAGGYLIAGVALELVVFVAAATDLGRRRLVGAMVGAGVAQLLLRIGRGPFFGSTALLAGAAAGPVLISGWMLSGRARRALLWRAGLALGSIAVVAGLAGGFALLHARTAAAQGIEHVRRGRDLARAGDTKGASREFTAAEQSFSSAHRDAGGWWARPAELLPGVGPQVASVDRLTAAGRNAAAAAATAANDADVDGFRLLQGQIDVAKIAAAAEPLSKVRHALDDVKHAIDTSRSPWLVQPLATRLDTFADQVDRARADAEVASAAVDVAPSLLGSDGLRRYFVIFGNPSEPRALGGFAGGYGELLIDHGKMDLVRTGRPSELNAGAPHPLTEPSKIPERFQAQGIDQFWQNVTGSPDFPTVAEAVRQLWPQSGGGPLDGVLYIDPYALSALLRLTGPVNVPGLSEQLTADNIVAFLTKDQYIELQIGDERHDLLSDVAKIVFDKMTSSDLPGPRQIADQLGPAAHGGRLLLNSFHPDEQKLFEQLEIDGGLPAADGDFLAVTTSNRGANKIDAFLTRTVEDDVVVDQTTGRVDASVRVTLHNAAPASGLPDVMIANFFGLPSGTNELELSVLTPLELDRSTLDGAPVPVGSHHEYGRKTYSAVLVLPPGATQTFELQLHGELKPEQPYRLTVVPKPNVGTEHVTVRVVGSAGARVESANGLTRQASSAETSEDLVSRRDYSVAFVQR